VGGEETFASHGEPGEAGWGPAARQPEGSRRFEAEPARYLEEKLEAALLERLLLVAAEALEPAVQGLAARLGGPGGAGGRGEAAGWEGELEGLRSLSLRAQWGPRDSIEEDSIFSLGKIMMSPR
jgi:hypothetical protein